MVQVVGVRFRKAGKVFYYDPNHVPFCTGQDVIVETSRGLEYGTIVTSIKNREDYEVILPLKRILRLATAEDKAQVQVNSEKAKEAFRTGMLKIAQHQLDMNLVDVEIAFDHARILFYFTADNRVDFRELVRDLASVFRTRIELRQIGARDEVKILGGIGPCGRITCCTTFLGEFAPVSIRMAKEQNLSLNPAKLSGVCGKLVCCLRYESEIGDQETVAKNMYRSANE